MNSLWIGLALGVLLACVVGYVWLRLRLLTPLKRLTELTGRLDELDTEEISRQVASITAHRGRPPMRLQLISERRNRAPHPKGASAPRRRRRIKCAWSTRSAARCSRRS